MAWTYSGDPQASPKDALRFAVGDTRQLRALLTDEEVLACLAQAAGSVTAASVLACRAIVFQLARKRNESVGSVSIQYAQEYDHFQAMLGNLEAQGGLFGAFTVYAGGTSQNDSDQILADRDRIPPDFERDRRRPLRSGLLDASPSQSWAPEVAEHERH